MNLDESFKNITLGDLELPIIIGKKNVQELHSFNIADNTVQVNLTAEHLQSTDVGITVNKSFILITYSIQNKPVPLLNFAPIIKVDIFSVHIFHWKRIHSGGTRLVKISPRTSWIYTFLMDQITKH